MRPDGVPFRYQMNAYFLYKAFGANVFYSTEAQEALQDAAPYKISSLALSGLRHRKYIESISKNDEAIKNIKDFSRRKNYQRFTEKGLAYVKWLDENKRLVTKYLLEL